MPNRQGRWLKEGILDEKKMKEIQDRVDSVEAASNIGSLPRKIASSFSGFTADQWKNWTNIFSILALKNIIPDKYLDNWRKYVLACRIVCSKYITEADIRLFDRLIIEFCTEFEVLYGALSVTPNMHLHGHLAECLRDYGPVYSFWLFSFERYNGHLSSLPNNSRAVEIQMMRRFLRDAIVSSPSDLPEEFRGDFSKHFDKLYGDESSITVVSDQQVLKVIYLSKCSAEVCNQPWDDISMYTSGTTVIHILSDEELGFLRSTYEVIYPDLPYDSIFPVTCKKCSVISLGNEVFGSCKTRYKRSSNIMAHWHSEDGQINTVPGSSHLTPGIVQKYIYHNLIIQGQSKVHLFAKVAWFMPVSPGIHNYYGDPIGVWSKDLFVVQGPSTFIPVQRIYCKFVRSDGLVKRARVSLVAPVNNGLNV